MSFLNVRLEDVPSIPLADIRLEVGVELEGPFVEQASQVAAVTYFGPYAG